MFAEETGQQTTSGVAAAIWFPYDAEPVDQVIPWAIATYETFAEMALDLRTGVSMIELRQFSRTDQIRIPAWAHSLGGTLISIESKGYPPPFRSGFSLSVPLIDTTVYLDYLRDRLTKGRGVIHTPVCLRQLEEIDLYFDLVINCAGFGAKALTGDDDLKAHRGQVVIVSSIESLNCAVVCDEAPLTYAIPRRNDCVFGGTNEIGEDRRVDPATTSRILIECCRVLAIDPPEVRAEKVGIRPFRKSGVRLENGRLADGRPVIHNYGHGGAGFTLSWGCAGEVLRLVQAGAKSARYTEKS